MGYYSTTPYGESPYGEEPTPEPSIDLSDDMVDAWDLPIPIGGNENITKLLHVVEMEDRRVDLDIEALHDNLYIDTATGTELEKIGAEVGARRREGESDAVYRKRILAEYGAKSSDTTYDEFALIASQILGADPSRMDIETPPLASTKTVELYVDGAAIEENPLSLDQLTDLLNRAVSAGASVNINEYGTFAFDGDDSTLEGFNEGTWSSQTN